MEYWQKTIFNRVSEGTLDSFLVRFRGVSVLHCHGVLVWRRAVFSTGKKLAKLAKDYFQYWQKTIFHRVSEGMLDSFLMRFRGVSVLHCHGVLVWRRAVFSTGGSTTGKGWQNWQKTIFNIGTGGSTTGKGSQNWQKAIFNRISKGTLDTFLVRFRGVSVLHCHGVLVWRRAVFSSGFSTTGKGWQNWQKANFNRVSEGTLDFFGALSWRVRPSLPWCFGVAEGCFQHRRQYNGKRLAKLAKDYF